jgi:phosphohistidine phosphatase
MKLYLCRHAAAKEFALGGDSQRALTAEGKKDFTRVAAGLATMNPRIDIIFTSPCVRTEQTAEILAATLEPPADAAPGHTIPIFVAVELACGGSPELLLKRLKSQKHQPQAMIAVGHEPDLSGFLGQLCFNKPGRVRFKKGAVACVDMDATLTHGELLFLMQPKQLMALVNP